MHHYRSSVDNREQQHGRMGWDVCLRRVRFVLQRVMPGALVRGRPSFTQNPSADKLRFGADLPAQRCANVNMGIENVMTRV